MVKNAKNATLLLKELILEAGEHFFALNAKICLGSDTSDTLC